MEDIRFFKGQTWKDAAIYYHCLWRNAQENADNWEEFQLLINKTINKEAK